MLFRPVFGSIPLGFNYPEWAKKQDFRECAQMFTLSTAKDFAKDPYRAITLPEPKEIGKCSGCNSAFMSQCAIEGCLCVERCAKFCCLCVGKDVKHETPAENEQFKFG
jgi:hypothetical protein